MPRPSGFAVLALIVLSGCPDDSTLRPKEGDPKGSLDAGSVIPPKPPLDAGLRQDAGIVSSPDAGSIQDAGSVDPGCLCPALPSTCTTPATNQAAFAPNGDALEQLFGAIACAEGSIRGAIYETDWPCIVDALLERLDTAPNLTLDLVVDDDRCPSANGVLQCELQRLAAHERVTIVDDQRSGLMHHKFLIIDEQRVWVSSANFTKRSFCTDFNNSLIVTEQEILGAYRAEFDRMFVSRQFGPTPPRGAAIGGGMSLYFSPESPITQPSEWFDELIRAVDTSSVSIDFMISAWTRTEVADALIRAHNRGVAVQGTVFSVYANDAPAQALLSAGVPIKKGSIHSKTLIVDGHLVISGSPNWSENSWSNNEASLWVDDSGLATQYISESDRIFAGANPL